jgi:hypothetical protein
VLARPGKKRERRRKEIGRGTRWRDRFILARGGGGWSMRRHHAADEGRDREGQRRGRSHSTGGWRPIGSGPTPVGTGDVARPCRTAGSIGAREGANRRAQTHSVG